MPFMKGHKINFGRKHSEETRMKISKSKKGKCTGIKNSFYGKKHTEESKRKLSKIKTGIKRSKETKRKISESLKGLRKGIKCSEETKRKMKEHKFSETHRRNLSLNHSGMIGKKHTEETKKKMGESHIKLMNNSSKFKYKDTSIEFLIESELKKKGLNYKKQKYIKGVGTVDFFLPDFNVIIECDGDYWHNLKGSKERDKNRDFASSFLHKYKTIRFWEHEINESPEKCMKKIFKVCC